MLSLTHEVRRPLTGWPEDPDESIFSFTTLSMSSNIPFVLVKDGQSVCIEES